METGKRIALGLVVLLTLGSCSAPAEPSPSPTPNEPEGRTEVDWSSYPPNYQQIVDEETTEGDCEALQEMFDSAPQDAALLAYIDEAMRLADCY